MDPTEYANIARLEDQHWWYRGMAAISLALLVTRGETAPPLTAPPLRILDAGCGPGGMLSKLAAIGQPIGLDFHPLAMAHAQHQFASRFPLLRASITQLPLPANHFDLITSFDVLCHRAVSDDRLVLSEFFRSLKPGGRMLLRVPALDSLRGAHDVVVHTQRRYTRAELESKLKAVGFNLHRLTYANSLLLPLIYIRRQRSASNAEKNSDVELPSAPVNKFLELVLQLERLWLTYFNLPIGVSLLALASKPIATRSI